MKTQIDHLVVMASSLDVGVQWCQDTLGITPAAGGEHEKYGTHNRLFKIATPNYPLAYFEIIAINPDAVIPKRSQVPRWFDMDDVSLQKAIQQGPRLIHFVSSTDDIKTARHQLRSQGIERGQVVHASRKSSKGTLNWQITVRDDGERLFNGTLPTLIQWGKPDSAEPLRLHPRNSLPRSGVTLQSLTVSHPSATKLQAAYESIGLQGVSVQAGDANIVATLQTPKGLVQLQSMGL
ncbi:VOC family protein [Limnohabitans sp. 2KL-3]|uniref:VOC family protein n=1 Tax=Limnohabitans sp. 2KL-3 TaxID=1100700 RepID=UPI000AF2727C|nr:VOC family protein [Limnohabitans sp. 2KL-3]